MSDGHGEDGRPRDPGRGEPTEGPLSFQDPSADEQARRWAHRQDPELEPPDRSGADGPPPPPRPRAPYGWLVALIVGLLLAYISFNTLRNVSSGRQVTRGVPAGKPLPPFATPLALSRLEGDSNVATAHGQGQRGNRAACTVRGPDILNSCQLTEGAPAVLAFIHPGAPECAAQMDVLQRASRRFPAVRFAALTGRTDRPALRTLIRRRGWTFPVGYDRRADVFALYGIVDCPTLTFAHPGGTAMRTTVRPLSDPQLTAAVTRLVESSRRRGWKPQTPA